MILPESAIQNSSEIFNSSGINLKEDEADTLKQTHIGVSTPLCNNTVYHNHNIIPVNFTRNFSMNVIMSRDKTYIAYVSQLDINIQHTSAFHSL